jgi:beta-phosphoglucomutase-like phosphatase (HAD superfamily)
MARHGIIKGFIFDLDGTIIDTGAYILVIWDLMR